MGLGFKITQGYPSFYYSYDTSLKPKQNLKLKKMTGHKSMIISNLNGKNFEGLWNRGTMISFANSNFMKTKFNDTHMEELVLY